MDVMKDICGVAALVGLWGALAAWAEIIGALAG